LGKEGIRIVSGRAEMNFGHQNALRNFVNRRRAERMDSIIAKVCCVGLLILLGMNLWGMV